MLLPVLLFHSGHSSLLLGAAVEGVLDAVAAPAAGPAAPAPPGLQPPILHLPRNTGVVEAARHSLSQLLLLCWRAQTALDLSSKRHTHALLTGSPYPETRENTESRICRAGI